MKRVLKITFWTALTCIAAVSIWHAVSITGAMVYFSSKWHVPKPKITSAEINFKLEYEIDGEKHEVSDALVCEFDGFSFDEGRGRKRRWKSHYKSMPKNNRLLIYQINEAYFLDLGVGTVEYFMAEPDAIYVPDNPYISLFDSTTGCYITETLEERELLEQHGFKVISWYCDPPIKNTFK